MPPSPYPRPSKEKAISALDPGAAPRKRRPRPRRPTRPVAPARRPAASSRRPPRRPAADRNPLYDPSQQLAGEDLRRAALNLVDLQYGPQERQLGRQMTNVTTQGTALAQRAADYSGQLAQRDQGLVPAVNAIGDTAAGAFDRNASQAQQAIQDMLSRVTSNETADQAIRGQAAGTDGATAEAQAQVGRVVAEQQAAKDAAASTTANYANLANLSAQARAQAGTETQRQLLTRLANQQTDVRARQSDLAAQKGAATGKALTDLRQQAFENIVTQQGLNIKSADIAAQTSLGQARISEQAKVRRQRARDNRASRSLRKQLDRDAAARKGSEVNQLGYTNAEWLRMTPQQRQDAIVNLKKRTADAGRAPKTPKGQEPMTQSATNLRTSIDSMLTDIRTDPKLSQHRNERGPRLVQILVKRGANPLTAQAAAELARYGMLRDDTASALRRAGIRLPRSWFPTGRTRAPRQVRTPSGKTVLP